jgi:hypothetical protein
MGVKMYTIKFLSGGIEKRDRVLAYLQERIVKENIFRATFKPLFDNRGNPCIGIKPVRLVKAKPYCGNHPGECALTTRKKVATYLEWNDWVRFHNFVNRVLNRFKANADVYSTPHDGKMWIRKGLKQRVSWDYTEEYNKWGQVVRIWNQGDDSQFM